LSRVRFLSAAKRSPGSLVAFFFFFENHAVRENTRGRFPGSTFVERDASCPRCIIGRRPRRVNPASSLRHSELIAVADTCSLHTRCLDYLTVATSLSIIADECFPFAFDKPNRFQVRSCTVAFIDSYDAAGYYYDNSPVQYVFERLLRSLPISSEEARVTTGTPRVIGQRVTSKPD